MLGLGATLPHEVLAQLGRTVGMDTSCAAGEGVDHIGAHSVTKEMRLIVEFSGFRYCVQGVSYVL